MMIWHIPARPLSVRWALILVGIAAFFWTGIEDDRVWGAVILGVLMTGVMLAHWLTGRLGGHPLNGRQVLAAWAGFGALTGGGGVFAAVVLMAFKDARHAHPFPDYPAGLLAATLERFPIWALAGALIGSGLYYLWRARSLR